MSGELAYSGGLSAISSLLIGGLRPNGCPRAEHHSETLEGYLLGGLPKRRWYPFGVQNPIVDRRHGANLTWTET
jgi:hypothetical protein